MKNLVNRNNLKIKQSNLVLTNVIVGLIIIILTRVIFMSMIDSDTKLKIYGWIGYIVLVWGGSTFSKLKKNSINVYTFYFIIYMLFSYGQILIYAFGISHPRYNLLKTYTDAEVLQYCMYFLISTVFYLNGAIIAVRKDLLFVEKRSELLENNKGKLTREKLISEKTFEKSAKIVSLFLFFISAPIYLYNLIERIYISINQGYGALYGYGGSEYINNNSSAGNIFNSIEFWFVPSLFFLLSIYKSNKRVRNILLMIVILSILGKFMTGGRGGAMMLFLAVVYLWDSEIRKIKKKQKVVLAILLVLVISSLPIIAKFRTLTDRSMSSLINTLVSNDSENLIIDVVAELGFSMQPWLMVNQLMPDYFGFRFGQSYVASFLAVIPSMFLGGVSFTKYANLAQWLMNVKKMNYGPGFSLHAESFYNFGWFGMAFMFVVGWFYFKLISNNFFRGPVIRYKNILTATTFYLFAMNIRDSMYLTIRNEVYFVLFPVLLMTLLYNTQKSNIIEKQSFRKSNVL